MTNAELDELREVLDRVNAMLSDECVSASDAHTLSVFVRAHLGCSTITDEQVEAALLPIKEWFRVLVARGVLDVNVRTGKQATLLNDIPIRAALEAAARVGTEIQEAETDATD